MAGGGTLRLAGGLNFYRVVTTRLVVSLEPTRNIVHATIGVRLRKQVDHLAAQRCGIVNGVPVKNQIAEKILATFVDGNDYVPPLSVGAEIVLWGINHRIQISLAYVIAVHQVRPFLHVCCDKRQFLLQTRITLPCWTDGVLKKCFRWNVIVTGKIDRAQNHLRPFRNLQHQSGAALDPVVHVDSGVAVFPVKQLQKKCGIIGPGRG